MLHLCLSRLVLEWGWTQFRFKRQTMHVGGDGERARARISIVSEMCRVAALLLVLQTGGDSTSRLCQTERKH